MLILTALSGSLASDQARAQATGDCHVAVTAGASIPSNYEVGCSSPTNQTADSALNPGQRNGTDNAVVSVTGVTISLPAGGSARNGIGVTAGHGNLTTRTDGGNADVTVTDTTITDLTTNGPSLGINIMVGPVNGYSTAYGNLTMSGTNAVTIGGFDGDGKADPSAAGNGGGILVDVLGMGNATATISGRINVGVNTIGSEAFPGGSPGQNDAIEVTSRAGTAMLDMSNLDPGSTVFVNGGNAIFVDSLCQEASASATTCSNPGNGGIVQVSNISSNLVITVDNSHYGSGWSGDPLGTANAGILVSSYGTEGTVSLGDPADPSSGNHAAITTAGPLSDAIRGVVQGGNVDANPQAFGLYINNSGALTTTGSASNGIEAIATNGAFVTTRYTGGAVALGGAFDSANVEVINSGAITTTDPTLAARANQGGRDSEHLTDPSNGIFAWTYSGGTGSSGNIEVHNLVGGDITVQGRFSDAIMAESRSLGGIAGSVVVSNDARLEAFGDGAAGIQALSYGLVPSAAGGGITITNSGTILTHGANATDEEGVTVNAAGINAQLDNHLISITNSGTIGADQAEAVLATVTDSGTGAFRLSNSGTIFGGDAGIRLIGNFVEDPTDPVVENNFGGTIGARSDLAIDSSATTAGSPLWINNNAGATITGYVTLGDAVNVMNNAGQWNLRNYSDITGTLGVAVADFGKSGANSIDNSGTIALVGAPVSGASVNAAGEYLPFAPGSVTNAAVSNPLNASVPGGPVQGQILGVATFTNSGVIDLTANPAAGDVLVISGGHAAGTDGGGVFVANGGSLRLNTVLNEGGIRSQSDMLVLDSTKLGSAPTKIQVMNAGGMGAATVGDGIALVEVLNKGASASGVFALGGRVAAGAFDYDLFHNGLGADAADGNWYLRSELRPEVGPDTVVPALAARLGLAMLGTYENRVGDGLDGADVLGRPGMGAGTCSDGGEVERPKFYTKYTKAPRPSAQCHATLLWGRVFGEQGAAGGGSATNGLFGSAGPAYSFGYGGFQAGADLYRSARDNAGLYASAASAIADVASPGGGLNKGYVSLNAYGIGGYWTHRAPGGWYSDLVFQGNWYDDIRSRSADAVSLNTNGWGITASAETGYVIALGNGYSVTPQGQLVYQRTDIRDGMDPFGRVNFGATDEIYGRLGARTAKSWITDRGQTVVTWLNTSVWHQFGNDATTTFATLQGTNPMSFEANLGGTWAQIGLGISGQVTRSVSIFGSADYNIALSQPGHGLGGRAGIRVSW
ncbi:MAG: autotransporter outer membrane beta-barrel domain-containing protein [Alphaproteobacteria bacterium]|nr:autotransporter outer membrane beta-barrel domain-containing protein [Alphaproteobacteria bacterium]